MRGKDCANADETSGTAGRGVEEDVRMSDGRERRPEAAMLRREMRVRRGVQRAAREADGR